MTSILGQAFLGAALILVLGILLALVCAWAPRLASWGETLGVGGIGQPPAAAPALPAREAPFAPAPAPRREAAPPLAVAPPEESLVAASIALALSLYQAEEAAVQEQPGPTAAGASPWVLSGRWQAMQARHRLQKR